MSANYPAQPERLVNIGDFYSLRPELDINLRWEFWHTVALLLQQHYLRRDRQARALARWLRLVQRTAVERDAALRCELCNVLGLPESTSGHDLIREIKNLRDAFMDATSRTR